MDGTYFWHNPEAEALGAIPTGSKAGQFLFLSAQTPIDMDTGEIIRDIIDLPIESQERFKGYTQQSLTMYGPVMAQTLAVYANLSKVLKKQGASTKDILRQRIYLTDISAVAWMEDMMLSLFPDEKPPTLVVGVPTKGVHQDIRIWVDVFALIPQADGLKKETIYIPELEKVNGPYPQATRAGQFLFFEGIRGIDAKTGRPVMNLDEIDPEVGAFRRSRGLYSHSHAEPYLSQYWLAVNGHIRKLLESQGGSLQDIMQLAQMRRDQRSDSSERDYVLKHIYKDPKNAPSQPGFICYNLDAAPEIRIIMGGIALLPGEIKRETTGFKKDETDGVLATIQKAGPFYIHTPLSFLREKRRYIVSFADFQDIANFHNKGHLLAQNRIGNSQMAMARAWYCYNLWLEKAAHFKAKKILHQTVYLGDISAWPAYEHMASLVLKDGLPPTTIVPVDIGCIMHYEYQVPYKSQNVRGERQPSSWWVEGERPEIQTIGIV